MSGFSHAFAAAMGVAVTNARAQSVIDRIGVFSGTLMRTNSTRMPDI